MGSPDVRQIDGLGGADPVKSKVAIISKSDDVFEKENPDAVLLYGDTNSCLAAIAAKKKKIPLFHFEAGNRCFDQRVPEETNRKIVDHLFLFFYYLYIHLILQIL